MPGGSPPAQPVLPNLIAPCERSTLVTSEFQARQKPLAETSVQLGCWLLLKLVQRTASYVGHSQEAAQTRLLLQILCGPSTVTEQTSFMMQDALRPANLSRGHLLTTWPLLASIVAGSATGRISVAALPFTPHAFACSNGSFNMNMYCFELL